jgi:hypothetical protein
LGETSRRLNEKEGTGRRSTLERASSLLAVRGSIRLGRNRQTADELGFPRLSRLAETRVDYFVVCRTERQVRK